MKTLFILNDAPYGTERSYNALRLAAALSKQVKQETEEIKMFLIGDAVSCSKKGQRVPPGYYNVEIMIKNVIRNKAEIGVCTSCMDARGLTAVELVEGSKQSTMEELSHWTLWADKVITF